MGLKCMEKFCGRIVSQKLLNEIIEIIETFPNLSCTELASTICELFSWKRCNGKLKSVECRQFLERLDQKAVIKLPASRKQFVKKAQNGFRTLPEVVSGNIAKAGEYLDQLSDYFSKYCIEHGRHPFEMIEGIVLIDAGHFSKGWEMLLNR